MDAAQQQSDTAWADFQAQVHKLKLQRSGLQRRLSELRDAATGPAAAAPVDTDGASDAAATQLTPRTANTIRVVLVTGFESFNQDLYKRAATAAQEKVPGLELHVFSDRDIESRREEMEAALDSADVFFGSLLFDYDQVEWLKARVDSVPVRLVFESSLELMGTTQVHPCCAPHTCA